MTLKEFKRLQLRNKWKLIIIPVVTAVSVYIFVSKLLEKKYTSDTTIFSGISSSYKIAGDNNAIDNQTYAANALGDFISVLNSRGVKEEVAIRLLAHHLMLDEPDPKVLNKADFEILQKKIPAADRDALVGLTLEKTIQNVRAAYHSDNTNIVYRVINTPKGPIWSLDQLGKITAVEVGVSELVKMEYSTGDPAVSYETLVLTNQVFIAKHDSLFSTQAKSVIGYFDTTTNNAFNRLHNAEQKLLDFSKQYNIADYEQEINSSTADKSASTGKLADLQLQYAGAVASLKTIEQSLKSNGVTNLESDDLIQQRTQLANLTKQLTEMQLYGEGNTDNATMIAHLKENIAEVSANIKNSTNKLYNSTHSTEGLPINQLLDEYIKDNVLVQQLKSQLDVMRAQNAGIAGNYSRLVPVGIQLHSLNRDVDLAEKDYLAQAEGLRQSKLTQENSLLAASHIKILDAPNFPPEPLNLAPVLAIAGFIAALIFVGGGLLASDMLDTSLKSPDNAEKITNFKILGVLPVLDANNKADAIGNKITQDEMARQLLLRFYKSDSAKLPFVVGVLSSYTGEGKSLVASILAENLNSFGVKTMALLPKDQTPVDVVKVMPNFNLNGDQVGYTPPSGIAKNSVADVTGSRFNDYSVILVEFPALLERSYPVSLLKHLDFVLLTVKADRTWLKPDVSIYENISKVTNAPIEIVLNGVSREYTEDFIGSPVVSH